MLKVSQALVATWFDYDEDKPKAGFKIRGMTGMGQYSFLNNHRDGKLKFDVDNCREMIGECLTDWRNIYGEGGKKVPFPGGPLAVDVLNKDIINFIVNKIMDLTFSNDDDKKKS